MPVLII